MKIGFVTKHNCIRVTKQAIPLMNAGHELHLFTNSLNFTEYYTTVSYYDSFKGLSNAIKQYPDIDIWHIHNEPSFMAFKVREVFPDAKIVLDMHDSNYVRYPQDFKINGDEPIAWYEEDVSIDSADALVVPSVTMGKMITERTGRDCTVIPSAVPKDNFMVSMNKVRGGLISNGGHSLPGSPEDSWRDYTKLYGEMNHRKKLFIACPQFTFNQEDKLKDHYAKYGTLKKLDYPSLITFASQCSWNLVGNYQGWVWNVALPNKFFDAVAAGTPSVVFNCPEVERIVKELDIGIVVKSVDELIDRWMEHKEKRINLYKARHALSMEAFLPRLEKLYETLGK